MPDVPDAGNESSSMSIIENFSKMGTYIGQQQIEEFTCHGYISDQPEGDIIEYWVSEELQEVLLAKSISNDKESTLRLFDIRRVEPDSELFTVPADYKDASSMST